MKRRVLFAGGDVDARLSDGKLRSFKAALKNSYQAEWILFNEKQWRCLINPEKHNEDYDRKEISIDFSAEMRPGDIFYWTRTDTHWLVSMREWAEEAYFRATVSRCDYNLELNGKKYWISLKGPDEKSIDWKVKENVAYNTLNYTIEILIQKTEETSEFFQRHRKVKFDGHNWVVAAVDRYSQPGVLQVYLNEDYDNSMEDAKDPLPEIIEPDTTQPYIAGPQLVEPYQTDLLYEMKNANGGSFVVNSSKVKIISMTDTQCILEILTGKATAFDLIYKRDGFDDILLNIKVNSF